MYSLHTRGTGWNKDTCHLTDREELSLQQDRGETGADTTSQILKTP